MPLLIFRFEIPISYWGRDYYGAMVGPLEMALMLLTGVCIF